MSSAQGISVGALDLALVDGSRPHLLPGWKVPVQAAPRGIDLELVVSSCDIDFDDPDGTTYRLGTAETRISKTYASIMKDVSDAGAGAADSDRRAQAALDGAEQAKAAAAAATAVSVVEQAPSGSVAPMAAGGGASVIDPEPGVEVVSASMAVTGSVCQIEAVIQTSDDIQAGGKVGTVAAKPVIATPVSLASGTIESDGSIVVGEPLVAGTHTISATYVKEVQ